MKKIIWLLLLTLLCSCQPNKQTNKRENSEEVQDSLPKVEEVENTLEVVPTKLSMMKLYYAEPHIVDTLRPSGDLDVRQGFIDVSESFEMPKGFIEKTDLRRDTIPFSKQQRRIFLEKMNYSEQDTIFIYDLESQLVKKRLIKDTPLMACINIYSQVSEQYKEQDYYDWDYEFGFNLGETTYQGFAVVGGENPFVEKGLKPLIFNEMSVDSVKAFKESGVLASDWGSDSTLIASIAHYEDINLFACIDANGNGWKDLIVYNSRRKEFVPIYQEEGESTAKYPLKLKGSKADYDSFQTIGRLFKEKPPVAFGFTSESFGCESIYFLSKDEAPLTILCDNRH